MIDATKVWAVALVAALLAAPATVGAQTTTEKAEKKADKAADKADRAMDKTKEVARDAKAGVTDSWVTSKTKIALFADDRVKGRQVNVTTKNAVVSLTGTVDTPEAKAAAEEVAKGIEGVKSVRNNLKVGQGAAMTSVNDADITKSVKGRVSKDSRLKNVDVKTDAGVVTLKGDVPNLTASARASELARQVPGVKAVKNDLSVKTDK